jgi:dipeptidyl aminopeptidase/acylaminoacyl peptidase
MLAATTESDSAAFEQKAKTAFSDWKTGVHPNVVASLTGVTDSTSEQRFLHTLDKSLRNPWMQYFLAYDPTENLAKIKCPVLAINGEKDIQVLAESNLAGWGQVKKNGNKDVTLKAMPNLNHLFQHCQKCTVAEYGELTETFSPEVLKIMGDWLTEKMLR